MKETKKENVVKIYKGVVEPFSKKQEDEKQQQKQKKLVKRGFLQKLG